MPFDQTSKLRYKSQSPILHSNISEPEGCNSFQEHFKSEGFCLCNDFDAVVIMQREKLYHLE